MFLLFLVWLITQVRRPSYFLVLALIAFLYALPHLLVEVQPRYHVTMTPYLLFGGLLFAHQWTERGAMFLASRWVWLALGRLAEARRIAQRLEIHHFTSPRSIRRHSLRLLHPWMTLDDPFRLPTSSWRPSRPGCWSVGPEWSTGRGWSSTKPHRFFDCRILYANGPSYV